MDGVPFPDGSTLIHDQSQGTFVRGEDTSTGNDWIWLKEEWGARMLADHGENWAETFPQWAQSVINDAECGNSRAFSIFRVQ